MFVDFEIQPRDDDFHKDGKMRLSSILNFFETASCKHSDLADDNILADTLTGKAWVMTDWFLAIDAETTRTKKLFAKTWIEKITSPFTCSRNYEFYCDDKATVRATTKWVVVDLATNRLQKLDSKFEETYKPEERRIFTETKLPKLVTPENFSNEVQIQVRRCDIDYNDHVHNLTYLDYALESLPEDVFNANNFKSLRISYKQAVKAGEKIVCKYVFADNKHTCCIFDENGELKTQVEFGC